MKKLCIDPGHGGRDPGAVFRGVQEKDIALFIAAHLEIILSGFYDIEMTRVMDTDFGLDKMDSLQRRCFVANTALCDYFVSIHCNADPDPDEPGMPEAEGSEIWIYPGAKTARVLANYIGASLLRHFPDEPFRGIKEGDLWVLHYTDMPAVLVEVGFIDNSETVRSFQDPPVIYDIAYVIGQGIINFAGR